MNQYAQNPATAREVADRGLRLGIDAVRNEPLQLASALVDDAQCGVPGAG
jgi:hypothetical protein